MSADQGITLTHSQCLRALKACYEAYRAAESLVASTKLFPASTIGEGDINPRLTVIGYATPIKESIDRITSILDGEEENDYPAEFAAELKGAKP